MKVRTIEKAITGYTKTLVIEHEGKTYNAELDFNEYNGYDLRFYNDKGEFIEMPEWADLYDNGQRSLDYDLDETTGNWEFVTDIMKGELTL
jgi:hypothetical protein